MNISFFLFVDKISLKIFMNKFIVFCILIFELKNERRICRIFFLLKLCYVLYFFFYCIEKIFFESLLVICMFKRICFWFLFKYLGVLKCNLLFGLLLLYENMDKVFKCIDK